MSSQKSKSTRARRARGSNKTESPTPPAERLASLLKCYKEHAFSTAPNALLHHKTPEEALKACEELATWLFRQSHGREGDQHIHLMMVHALVGIQEQLKPLFETVREIAEGERS